MILIALGANLPSQFGSPEDTLRASIEALKAYGVQILSVSKIWITEPVPVSDQPLYRNAVISVQTNYDALKLLNILHDIEADFGRQRITRNEARVIDLDLIAYNNYVHHNDDLYVPHPRMHERGFVLVPLNEIAPDWKHPVLQKTPVELIDLLADQSQITTMREVA